MGELAAPPATDAALTASEHVKTEGTTHMTTTTTRTRVRAPAVTAATPAVIESAEQRASRLYGDLGPDPAAIADELLAELGVTRRAAHVLRGWVRERVANHVRAIQLAELHSQGETDSQSSSDRKATRVVHRRGPNPDIGSALAFLKLLVAVPGAPGGHKRYGQMTAADHAARVGQARGCIRANEEIARNGTWAQEVIAKHRVTCLDDVPAGKLVAELPDGGVMRP